MRCHCAVARQSPDAALGFLNEDSRQRLNLAKSMTKAGWAAATAADVEQLRDDLDRDAPLGRTAKQFNLMCDDFDGGSHLYVIYRYLSGHSHASATLAASYLQQASYGEVAVRELDREPGHEELMTLGWCLIWASRALDYIVDGSPMRSELKAQGKRVGIRTT